MRSALVVLFNQDYSKNIPKLERLYTGRFSKVIYLVPDYWSRLHRAYIKIALPIDAVSLVDKGVHAARRLLGRRNSYELEEEQRRLLGRRFLRVTGHQFFFYDFVRQAANDLLSVDVDWYWVVGDDAILNPGINENNLSAALGMGLASDAVICRPVISSDAWLCRIGESVGSARTRLEQAVGPVELLRKKLQVEPEAGAIENKDVAVACADFFGLSRDVLRRILPYWRACLRNRLYVELTLPNSVLAACHCPTVLDNFFWTRWESPEKGCELLQQFQRSDAPVFVHPVKLSMLPDECLDSLL